MNQLFKLNVKIGFILIVICHLSAFRILAVTSSLPSPMAQKLISVLILSGKNNHEWQKTTPLLVRILKESNAFKVTVTEFPDTLSYGVLKKFQVVISNWNTWPDNKLRLSPSWESDLLRYVTEGGGLVTIHAGGSSFYDWEGYQRLGIGRWGKDTKHGPRTLGHVYNLDQNHPITKGMAGFFLMDEIWEKSEIYPGSSIIGSVSAKSEKDGHPISEPALIVNQTGKGRCFFTPLGHDERALLNSGLQFLLLRAAQWCAGEEVTIQLPLNLRFKNQDIPPKYFWQKSDTALSLQNNSMAVWQFNFNNRFGKPYFHPLLANQTSLTSVSPPDHTWHLGLWFSWKYINGVNYWEYLPQFSTAESGYKSEGVTELGKKRFRLKPDFSADLRISLRYHPAGATAVLEESRRIHLSTPFADGSYYLDEEHLFTALADTVLLDRTPLDGEPGGKSWGGYAGLSMRFNQDFTGSEVFSNHDSTNLKSGDWVYMVFNGVDGKKAGLLMMNNPAFTLPSSCWYVINNPQIPFYYYSPAVLFNQSLRMKKGQKLQLKYRIWVLPGKLSTEQIQQKYDQYVN